MYGTGQTRVMLLPSDNVPVCKTLLLEKSSLLLSNNPIKPVLDCISEEEVIDFSFYPTYNFKRVYKRDYFLDLVALV